jgi:GGDEF domain-containing protein
MSIVAEPVIMQDSLSGGTTNLLRMARNECRGAIAFVALALDDDVFATATYPTMPEDDLFGMEGVDEMVHQAWSDPEFGHARTLVRAARLKSRRLVRPRRLVLAIVPLGDGPGGGPWGMLGVVDPEGGSFQAPQLELLDRIAQRLASYLRARQEVRQNVLYEDDDPFAAVSVPVRPTEPTVLSQGERVRPDVPWWTVEPGPLRHDTITPPSPATWAMPVEPEGSTSGRGASAEWTASIEVETRGEMEAPAGPAPASEPLAPPEPLAPAEALAPPEAPVGPAPAARPEVGSGVLSDVLAGEDPVTGLLSLGAFLGRAGRMLGAGAVTGGGALAVVVMEVAGLGELAEDVVTLAAHAMREQLRFDDPVAQIGRTSFAAVVPLVPGGSDAKLVEERLAAALRAAVADTDEECRVRSAHVVAELAESHDADELLRSAVGKLRVG